MFLFMPDFSAAVRTLTSFGSGTLLTFSLQNQSLAASATVSTAPAAGRLRVMGLGLKAGAAGTLVAQFSDGTNLFPITTAASGTSVALADSASTNPTPITLKNNDAANAATWSSTGADFIT